MALELLAEPISSNLLSMVLFIVSSMLVVTVIAVHFNRDFETVAEFYLTIILSFVFLFLIFRYQNSYPYNLLTCYLYAGIVGWMIGPLIDFIRKTKEKGNEIVQLAALGTLVGVLSTAAVVYFTNLDFSFLEMYLFVGLIAIIIINLLRIFVIKTTSKQNIAIASFSALIFIGWLLFDFHRLKTTKEATWGNAVDISVNLYLDIVNLFLDLLEILSEAS